MSPTRLTESCALTITEADKTTGRLKIGIITPGWGSSGYYSPKVLENAATAKVFPAGTHMFLDHPSETERHDRPERSVRDLAAVLTSDATWDGHGLVAEAKVFSAYRELLTDPDLAESIGVSIRASANVTTGEAEGRRGQIITELTEAQSVDFVTQAGRGGRVLAVLESARAARIDEATTDDVRDRLQRHLRDIYPADDDGYAQAWVVDFDPDTTTVYYRTPDGLFAQGYTLTPDGADLSDDPREVRQVATYVPVTTTDAIETASPQSPVTPAGSTTTHESEEDTMSNTTISEARLAELEADAGRVQTLESERDAARRERDEAREALAARDRTDKARTIIATQAREAGITFTALEERGLLADLPLAESGELDTDAYTRAVTEAAATKATSNGAGKVTGFGTTSDATTDATESDPWAAADAALKIKEA